MKKSMFILFLLFFAAPMTPLAAQPKLEVAGGMKFDLGTLYRGEIVERKLLLKNAGDSTLVLGQVMASCGCTGTVLSNDHIAPGESGTLQITFNSKNFTGPVHKTVTMHSNATGNPQMIEFTATVVNEIEILPTYIWFKEAEVGKTTTLSITLKNSGKESLKLTGFRTKLSGFILKFPAGPVKPGETAQVIAEFTPAQAAPTLTDAVFIITSNPHQQEVYVPIYGNVKDFKFQ